MAERWMWDGVADAAPRLWLPQLPDLPDNGTSNDDGYIARESRQVGSSRLDTEAFFWVVSD